MSTQETTQQTTQVKREYLIVSFFILSTLVLSSIQSYAVYLFSTEYMYVASMLAAPFAVLAGLIPDSTVWLSHLLEFDTRIKRGIQGLGLAISVGIGLLFSYLIVGESTTPIISMTFYTSFQVVGILLQFITSKPSLDFIFGEHIREDSDLSQLDRLKNQSDELATRFNRADELSELEKSFNVKLSTIETAINSVDRRLTSLEQTTPDIETLFNGFTGQLQGVVTTVSQINARLYQLEQNAQSSEVIHREIVSLHQLVKTIPTNRQLTTGDGFTLPPDNLTIEQRHNWLVDNRELIDLTSKAKLATVLGVSRTTLDSDFKQLNGRLS